MKARNKIMIIAIICLCAVIALLCAIMIKQEIQCTKMSNELDFVTESFKKEFHETDSLRIQNGKLQNRLDKLETENDELRQALKAALTAPPAVIEQQEPEKRCEKSSGAPSLVPIGIATNMFRCEDFRRLNVKSSDQYRLQQECFTDAKTGIRFLYEDREKYLCAALAGAYGTTIGDTWQVTLQSGYSFNIIMADFKHPIDDIDPNDFGDSDTNYDGEPCINIIEFVCDLKISPKAVIDAGTMSAFEEFGGLYGDGGNIVSMKYLGRKWEP